MIHGPITGDSQGWAIHHLNRWIGGAPPSIQPRVAYAGDSPEVLARDVEPAPEEAAREHRRVRGARAAT